ncbi:unnamed protein product [Larinioides sclopetarius]|uniref:Uncharacterized protein n=1 Tax=Larinioides sclopetarius TaxID=280406 RepID=A0AAV1Z863_9ARAC
MKPRTLLQETLESKFKRKIPQQNQLVNIQIQQQEILVQHLITVNIQKHQFRKKHQVIFTQTPKHGLIH